MRNGTVSSGCSASMAAEVMPPVTQLQGPAHLCGGRELGPGTYPGAAATGAAWSPCRQRQ